MAAQIQSFFSPDELNLLEQFKNDTGMTYRAILEKAIDYYLQNDLPYIQSEYIRWCSLGKERKKRKNLNRSEETLKKLSIFCIANNYSLSSVAAQAIVAYVNAKSKELNNIL